MCSVARSPDVLPRSAQSRLAIRTGIRPTTMVSPSRTRVTKSTSCLLGDAAEGSRVPRRPFHALLPVHAPPPLSTRGLSASFDRSIWGSGCSTIADSKTAQPIIGRKNDQPFLRRRKFVTFNMRSILPGKSGRNSTKKTQGKPGLAAITHLRCRAPFLKPTKS